MVLNMFKSIKINYLLAGLAFMFMMIMPFKFQIVKLSLVLVSIVYAAKKNQINPGSYQKNWVVIFILCNLLPFIYAIISGNPGYDLYINTYFLWPILYSLLVGSLNDDFYEFFHKILSIGIWVVLGIGLYVFIFYNLNGIVSEDILSVQPKMRPGMPFITISDGCVNSIIFLYSYFLVFGLLNKDINYKLLASCFVFVFVTSRRVIYAELVLAIILYVIIASVCKIKIPRKIISSMIIGVIIFAVVAVSLIRYYGWFEFNEIIDAFEAISEASDGERIEQYKALINGWLEKPFLGNGTGIDASYSRSDKPGTYELSYIAILFERGVIGFTIYIGLLLSLNVKAIKTVKRFPCKGKYLIPHLIAIDMMLVANATNNYIQAFDYTWVLFILFPFFRRNKNEILMTASARQRE